MLMTQPCYVFLAWLIIHDLFLSRAIQYPHAWHGYISLHSMWSLFHESPVWNPRDPLAWTPTITFS